MPQKNLNPTVAIIVPAFNCEAYLGECLDSVLAQTYPYWECVVVDDGSTDGTYALAESYSKRDGRIRCLKQANQGPSITRNNGIHASSGEFILPLDGDDTIDASYLEQAIHYFTKYPETKLVYCQASFFGEKEGRWDLPTYNYDSLLWDNMIFNAAIFRRSDYDKTPGYNSNMVYGLEDWDFWITLLNPQDQIHRIEEILFHYRIKPKSRNKNNTDTHIDEMHRQIVKNHLDIYTPFIENIINMRRELNLGKEELNYYQNELKSIRGSREYRLGRKIYSTLHKLKRPLHK